MLLSHGVCVTTRTRSLVTMACFAGSTASSHLEFAVFSSITVVECTRVCARRGRVHIFLKCSLVFSRIGAASRQTPCMFVQYECWPHPGPHPGPHQHCSPTRLIPQDHAHSENAFSPGCCPHTCARCARWYEMHECYPVPSSPNVHPLRSVFSVLLSGMHISWLY